MKETIERLKKEIVDNKEQYYSSVNEKGKEKYKLQVLEKKVIEQSREIEEQQIHNDHLKKSIQTLSGDIDTREHREMELRSIMVVKISEIRRLQTRVDEMESRESEMKR